MISIKGYMSCTEFPSDSDPLSYRQYYIEHTLYKELPHLMGMTTVQRSSHYRQKWGNKYVEWSGVLDDVQQHESFVLLTLSNCIGYTTYTFSDDKYAYRCDFSVRIIDTNADECLNFNKGEEIIVKGSLPPSGCGSTSNLSDLLQNCTIERKQKRPPTKKKSFWPW